MKILAVSVCVKYFKQGLHPSFPRLQSQYKTSF